MVRYNKAEKIKRILEVTGEMLQQKGFANLVTNKIAKKAGVSIALLYKYFPEGKYDLIREITKNFINKSNFGELKIDVEISSPKKMIHSLIMQYIQTHRINIPLQKALFIAHLERPDIISGEFLEEFETLGGSIVMDLLKRFPNHRFHDSNQEDFIQKFLFTLDAVVHRHLYEFPVAETDAEFAEYLTWLSMQFFGFNE